LDWFIQDILESSEGGNGRPGIVQVSSKKREFKWISNNQERWLQFCQFYILCGYCRFNKKSSDFLLIKIYNFFLQLSLRLLSSDDIPNNRKRGILLPVDFSYKFIIQTLVVSSKVPLLSADVIGWK
jgi:hypothetical protein